MPKCSVCGSPLIEPLLWRGQVHLMEDRWGIPTPHECPVGEALERVDERWWAAMSFNRPCEKCGVSGGEVCYSVKQGLWLCAECDHGGPKRPESGGRKVDMIERQRRDHVVPPDIGAFRGRA